MKHKISVTFSDKQGLEESLMKEGYTKTEIEQAKHLLRVQFEKSARRLFEPGTKAWQSWAHTCL